MSAIPTFVPPSILASDVTVQIPMPLQAPSTPATYASASVHVASPRDTGVILFPDASRGDEVISRSSIEVLVHLTVAGVSVTLLALAYVIKLFSPDSVLASGPVTIGLLLMVVLSSVSMLVEPYRYIVYGFAYLTGLAVFMTAGALLNDDAVLFGRVYMGIIVLLLLVSLILWMQTRQAPWSRRNRLS